MVIYVYLGEFTTINTQIYQYEGGFACFRIINIKTILKMISTCDFLARNCSILVMMHFFQANKGGFFYDL
jgi:hypothetical protein